MQRRPQINQLAGDSLDLLRLDPHHRRRRRRLRMSLGHRYKRPPIELKQSIMYNNIRKSATQAHGLYRCETDQVVRHEIVSNNYRGLRV